MSPDNHTPTVPEEGPMHPSSLSVLHVDDEQIFRDICRIYLGKYGISVTSAGSVREALRLLETGRFDVIVSDYQMPGIDGAGFLKILREKKIELPVVIFSAENSEKALVRSIGGGAMYYVQKGGNPRTMFEKLSSMIREAVQKSTAKEALHETTLRYRSLFELSGTAIVAFDDNLTITTANSGFLELTGYGRDEIEGVLQWTDLVHESDASHLKDYISHIRSGSTPPAKELSFLVKTKDNQTRPVLATVSTAPHSRWSIASMIEIWRAPVYRGTLCTKDLNQVSTNSE